VLKFLRLRTLNASRKTLAEIPFVIRVFRPTRMSHEKRSPPRRRFRGSYRVKKGSGALVVAE
jgi:hypothetical protein